MVVTEPHNVPLQFVTETGIVGFLLALGSVAAATLGVVRVVRRLRGQERAAAVALSVSALAYVLHSLVDFDWDFVAVSAPFLVTVGVLLGGKTGAGERRTVYAPLPAIVASAVAFSLLLPWFAQRSTDSAVAALEAGGTLRGRRRAPRALAQPARARAAVRRGGRCRAARGLPRRARALHEGGRVAAAQLAPVVRARLPEVSVGDHPGAVAPLRRAVELDGTATRPTLLQQVEARLGLSFFP